MVKKQVVIEELSDIDSDFEYEDDGDAQSQGEEEAPVFIKRSQAREQFEAQ
jgi:hypothetical protein